MKVSIAKKKAVWSAETDIVDSARSLLATCEAVKSWQFVSAGFVSRTRGILQDAIGRVGLGDDRKHLEKMLARFEELVSDADEECTFVA
ncbi:MAG TPA: hypothetical protein VI981_04130 [Candidatus Paceibacterota bacterium]